jgi:hypothetical protein
MLSAGIAVRHNQGDDRGLEPGLGALLHAYAKRRRLRLASSVGGEGPPMIDSAVSHPARICNYCLGGKDNYPVDREAGEQTIAVLPEIVDVARESRQFLVRVVRYLAADAGICQFLDIGTGCRRSTTLTRWPRRSPGIADGLRRQRPAHANPCPGAAVQKPRGRHVPCGMGSKRNSMATLIQPDWDHAHRAAASRRGGVCPPSRRQAWLSPPEITTRGRSENSTGIGVTLRKVRPASD